MELRVKLLKWSAGIPVAMINPKTAGELGIHEGDRISIKNLEKRDGEFSTIVDIAERLVGKNEIGISKEIKGILDLKNRQKVDINLAKSPNSLNYIRKKLDHKQLSKKEFREIIKDIVNNSLSEPEIALFISAMYENKLTFRETIDLIGALLENGNKLSFDGGCVVDKHSIGGIPGNRTTPLVVSICAAAGLIFPKSSSKAITSAAGTADVIGAIAKVEFPLKELKKIIRKTGACMVWGGSIELVPADSKILKIEKLLKIDSRAQMLASIMSKKLASGSKCLLIDIPYGKTAKVNKSEATILKKDFEKLAKHFKLKIKVVLTDGSEPIGNGIGPILELIDIIKILNPSETGPADLEKKAIFLSGQILELSKKAKSGQGEIIAKKILDSGKAFEKFIEIIKAQKGNLKNLKPGKFKKDFRAKKTCKVKEIDNKKINLLARIAGCPLDKSSGLYLHAHANSKLKKSDKIITIYAESKSRLNEAIYYFKKQKPIKLE